MTDSNTIGMYLCLSLAIFFFLLAIYVHSQERFPFSENELKNPETYFRGLMAVSVIFTCASVIIALKKKDKVTTHDGLQASVTFLCALSSLIIAWQSEANLLALGSVTLASLLSASVLNK